MHKPSLLFFASLLLGLVSAEPEFIIITTQVSFTPSVSDFSAYYSFHRSIASVAAAAASASYTAAHPSLFAEASSIESKLREFVATQTFLTDIPSVATYEVKVTLLAATPPWFIMLPDDVKSYKKAQASAWYDIEDDVVKHVEGERGAAGAASLNRGVGIGAVVVVGAVVGMVLL